MRDIVWVSRAITPKVIFFLLFPSEIARIFMIFWGIPHCGTFTLQ